MKIVDSPGVVFDEDEEDAKGQRKGSILLRNVVKVEDVEDPIAVGESICIFPRLSTEALPYSRRDSSPYKSRNHNENLQSYGICEYDRVFDDARSD